MPSIALITATAATATNDNAPRIAAAYAARGWHVQIVDHEAIALEDSTVVVHRSDGLGALDAERIWLFGFGAAASFLDRMQMLRTRDRQVFVNHPDALVAMHGKVSLRGIPGVKTIPGLLSNRVDDLYARITAGDEWIVKPPAGSFGRDVYRVHASDTNTLAILESMTRDGRYVLLEQFIGAAHGTEKRVLVAGGRVISAYAKCVAEHRGNLNAGMTAHTTRLETRERDLVDHVARVLADRGVLFSGIDLLYPYVIEANVANPGFLSTYESLTGEDRTPAVLDALDQFWSASE